MELPTVKYFPQKFRGPSSSADYNEFSRLTAEDIANLYNLQNVAISDISEKNKLSILEFIHLNTRYQSLLTAYNNIYETLNSFTNSGKQGRYYIGYFNTNNIHYGGFTSYPEIPESERCNINAQYGCLLPYYYSQTSRIFLHDDITGYTFVPKSLSQYKATDDGEILIRVKNRDYNAITMNDIKKLFDCNQETVWYLEVKYPNSTNITSCEVMLDIPLPVEIINSLDCNYCIVEPFPAYGVSVESIKYTSSHRSSILYGASSSLNSNFISPFPSADQASWTTIDNFASKNYDGLYTFNTKSVTGIRLHLKTDVYTILGNERVFTLGCRNLDFGYMRFAPSRCLNVINLTSHSFKKVKDPKNTTGNSNLLVYKLYYDMGSGDLTPYEFNKVFPAGIHKVYVETSLTNFGIPGLGVEYEIY